MNAGSRVIAVLTASALLLAGVFLLGRLPAFASAPAVLEPRHDPVSSATGAMPSGIGVQATITQTAVLLSLELLLVPIYYNVDLPLVTNAAP